MQLKTIKQVRKDLRLWGGFWARAEMGQGYAKQSPTARICDMLRTKVQVSSDLHLFSHHADQMFVPSHIDEINRAVEKLSHNCKAAIKDKYIKQRKRDDLYLKEAENSLISLLS